MTNTSVVHAMRSDPALTRMFGRESLVISMYWLTTVLSFVVILYAFPSSVGCKRSYGITHPCNSLTRQRQKPNTPVIWLSRPYLFYVARQQVMRLAA
jgi:hypothetical protein